MRALVLLVAVATLGFVPPKLQQKVEITGRYVARGTHPDGSTYEGGAVVERIGGDRYEITFEMESGTFRALCLRDGDRLGCGWGATRDLGVMVYRAAGGGLDGTWSRDGDDGVGHEHVQGAGATSLGSFAAEGTSPTGASYSAQLTRSAAAAGVEHVEWQAGGPASDGWAISDGELVVAGFPGVRCGAALYRIASSGQRLEAVWMDFSQPDLGTGRETLTRSSP